jgi:CRP/FNR family transcriptional regulator, cyclic AMP receptor protein
MRKGLYILGDLEDRDLIWMSRHGAVRELRPGEMLISAGRDVADLFFVTDGRLAVTGPAGAAIATLSTGDVIGEMSFVEKRPPSASVTATGPARVLAIPRAAILAEFAADNAFAARFYRALAVFLSDRLRAATSPGDDAAGELDEAILDNVHQAGDRFIRLVGLLEGRVH